MNIETKKYIRQWIIKANEDLFVVNKLTEGEILATSSVCFHCQQSVEKFLKAYLFANGKDIKKTHNIEFLLSECEDIDPKFSKIDPKNLSDFGVDIRYPGDMYVPSVKEAMEYKEIAITVKNIFESKIEQLLIDNE